MSEIRTFELYRSAFRQKFLTEIRTKSFGFWHFTKLWTNCSRTGGLYPKFKLVRILAFRCTLLRFVVFTCENVMKRRFDVGGVKCRRFNKRQIVLFGKSASLFSGNGSKVSQVWLVAHQHDHNVGVGVVAKFTQPTKKLNWKNWNPTRKFI